LVSHTDSAMSNYTCEEVYFARIDAMSDVQKRAHFRTECREREQQIILDYVDERGIMLTTNAGSSMILRKRLLGVFS